MNDAISIHVGLNRVDPVHYGSERRLHGCRNDANAMYRLAVDAGFSARTPLLDDEATIAGFRGAVKAAINELSPGGILLLTYAGHGARLPDIDAPECGSVLDEGTDGYDEAWCLFDRMMRDDEVCGLLAELREGQRVLAVLDSCFSGTALDAMLPAGVAVPRDAGRAVLTRGIPLKTALAIRALHPEDYKPSDGIRLARRSELRATVLELAACGERDRTPDGPEHGEFTAALLKALAGPPVESYDALHSRVAEYQAAHSAVLHPRDESTRAFRLERPFQVRAEAAPAPSAAPLAPVAAGGEGNAGSAKGLPGVPAFCAQVLVPASPPPAHLPSGHLNALITTGRLWANGTVVHYALVPSEVGEAPGEPQCDVVRKAFATWKSLGIGLVFVEVADPTEAELRIGFVAGSGSWSHVGRDALKLATSERTMNFGWDLTGPGGADTALHEIGHALGMQHEHQNWNSGIEWDAEAVYQALAGPDNYWSREQTDDNILRKLDRATSRASTWDSNSVMHYPFGPGLVLRPDEYRKSGIHPAGGLSDGDRAWVRLTYPPIDDAGLPRLAAGRSEPLPVAVGAQQDFRVEPDGSREYTVRTFGACDTTLTVFEANEAGAGAVPDHAWRFLAGDDDGGEARNAQIRLKLLKGRQYRVRVRIRFADASQPASVMLW